MKRALITGITGQDGIHLTELLLSKNYVIFGTTTNVQSLRAQKFQERFPTVRLGFADLTDIQSLIKFIELSAPDELYNLGAVSSFMASESDPELCADINGLGPLRLIEAIRFLKQESKIKFFQASTSQIFGHGSDAKQNENSLCVPTNIYGISKLFAQNICTSTRKNLGIHVSCGILFNHEGENRPDHFVSRKISKSIALIKLGKIKNFELENLDSVRDWGYAGDYVEAMWLMLQNKVPDDFIVATSQTHSVRDFLTLALKAAEIRGEPEDYVTIKINSNRTKQIEFLSGDASKAHKILGWKPKTSFDQLVEKMVKHDLTMLSNDRA
jgi:GDPmannose 4,6-dehydratase